MKIIAISSPIAVAEEVTLIKQLLQNGVDVIHIRKPLSEFNRSEGDFFYEENRIDAIDYIRLLLQQLSTGERDKIIIHDYYELYEEYALKGVHINKNITHLPDDYNGFRSRSCHTFEEVTQYKDEFDYLFLSPIFDSISKAGYRSAFDNAMLQQAAEMGIIDDKVIALGGVTLDKIPLLRNWKFGGIAMSGAIYTPTAITDLKRFKMI